MVVSSLVPLTAGEDVRVQFTLPDHDTALLAESKICWLKPRQLGVRFGGMTLETLYTIRRIQSPCGSRSAVVFDLTYRRVWRSELGDDGQWCDFLVERSIT